MVIGLISSVEVNDIVTMIYFDTLQTPSTSNILKELDKLLEARNKYLAGCPSGGDKDQFGMV